ncbi:MAG: ASKHA domain-containing protein [Cloacibacillus evryensis]
MKQRTALCCSAAAGPILRSENKLRNARASGAIEKAWRENGDSKVKTIYDAPVEGICGSGLDVIAFMIDEGIIRPNGKANIEI